MNSIDKMPTGCCGETLINFSLLRMPDTLYLNINDLSLWCTAVVIFAEPYFKSMVGIQEKQKEIFSHFFGQNLAFLMYIIMSYLYSIWTFVFFSRAVSSQPRMLELQRNEILITGYLFLLIGLLVKVYTYITTSVIAVMGGHYFKLRTAVGEGDLLFRDPYYHPLGTASVMCYFGFSLIQGSVAGLLLTMTLAIAYYTACHFERFPFTPHGRPHFGSNLNEFWISVSQWCWKFVIQKTKQLGRGHLKQDIHHSQIPPPIRGKTS